MAIAGGNGQAEEIGQLEEEIEEIAQPGVLKGYLEDLLPMVVDFAVRAAIALIIYAVGMKIIKFLRKVLRRALERSGADEGVRQFMDSFAKVVLYFVLVVAVIHQLGIETSSVVAVIGSAGLAFGLALQGSLANIAGGMLILWFKPFKVGDYIIEDTHGNEGTVTEIKIFYTRLTTVDNRVVVVPNGTLANTSLVNVTGQDKRRVDLSVGISYEADIRRAKELLMEMLRKEESRLPDEEMVVFVEALEDSCVRLGCRIWVAKEEYWDVKWRLTEEIKEMFDENGIEIPHLSVPVPARLE